MASVLASVTNRGAILTSHVLGFLQLTTVGIEVGVYISSPAFDAMGFFTKKTEAVRINPAGYVGIGTTTPKSWLHVRSDVAPPGKIGATTGITVDIPGLGSRPILVGPPDSGGPNYRSLRVAN